MTKVITKSNYVQKIPCTSFSSLLAWKFEICSIGTIFCSSIKPYVKLDKEKLMYSKQSFVLTYVQRRDKKRIEK